MNQQTKIPPEPMGKAAVCVSDQIEHYTKMLYREIIKINLQTGQAVVLYSTTHAENIGYLYDWDPYLQWYLHTYLAAEDWARAWDNFQCSRIQEHIYTGKNLISLDFSYLVEEKSERATVLVYHPQDAAEEEVCWMVRRTGEDYILKDIVELYVYNNCDYFIYLNAKNNSYTMFSSNADTPLPAVRCLDYAAEMRQYIFRFVAEEDRERVVKEMRLSRVLQVLEEKDVHTFSYGVIDAKRGYTRKRLQYRYHDRRKQMILLSRTDVTQTYMEEKKRMMELQTALLRAQTDPLTKLWNHQSTIDKITDSLQNTHIPHALLFIDLDNFKKVNDTFGHAAGDALLCKVAQVLKAHVTEQDIAGRIGGDEFVFFSTHTETKEQIAQLADEICQDIHKITVEKMQYASISCSIGIAVAPQDGNSYESLSEKADKCLYEAKMLGKNQYYFA